ncbi:MAG: TetR/AcrR family transcriptional regulator [Alphaproteobacteria bacterium]|nr:TetR/AcrR family transcriptional regulator [Alphaproteobacteria bacterium]
MLESASKKPASTRERLLELAEQMVLRKGFASTSIEELIAGVGITKSGFFYHFKDKNDLARALMQRYLEDNKRQLDGIFARAAELHEDPLHSFLIGLKLFAELMNSVHDVHPGCIAAAVIYQDQAFDAEVRSLSAEGMLDWRKRFRTHLDRIVKRYPPKIDVDLDSLADMMSALADGGIILSKALKDRTTLPAQIMHYRNYIKLLFEPA